MYFRENGFKSYTTKFSLNKIILLCILILALILRLINLGSRSLWLDETVNIELAGKSMSFIWAQSLPPLYLAVLHYWLAIGKSEVIVRFLSVIFGILSVFIIYKIGIRLYGEKEALISAFLMSISQTEIYFSQETRYYPLFIFLSLVSIFFFLRMEERPTNPNRVLFLISMALAFYTHYFAIILFFTLMIYKIWDNKKYKKGQKDIKPIFALITLFCLLIVPVFSNFVSQTSGKAETSYFNFQYEAHLSRDFIKNIFTYLIVNEFYPKETILPYVILGFFLYGVFSSLKYFEKSISILMIWIFLPITFAAVLTNFISDLQIRYLVFILPALFLISSHGISTLPDGINHISKGSRTKSIKWNYLIIILSLIIVVLSSYPILNYYYSTFKDYQWREAAEFLGKNGEPGSNIVLVPGYNISPFSYYYKSKDKSIIEYSTLDEFIKLSHQNNTYLVATQDVYGLKPDEFKRLLFWSGNNMEIEIKLSGINILKTSQINSSKQE